MPPREWRVRVNDIVEAAERALGYVQGLTFDQFASDPRTVDAVSYAIVVIGEAAKAIPETVTRAAPEIPWADVRGMRNRIAHEYFGGRREGPLADGARRPTAAACHAENACGGSRSRLSAPRSRRAPLGID